MSLFKKNIVVEKHGYGEKVLGYTCNAKKIPISADKANSISDLVTNSLTH